MKPQSFIPFVVERDKLGKLITPGIDLYSSTDHSNEAFNFTIGQNNELSRNYNSNYLNTNSSNINHISLKDELEENIYNQAQNRVHGRVTQKF